MGEGTIRLGAEGQRRARVLNDVLAGRLTSGEAATVLGLSERQVKRLKAAYRRAGPAALVHGNTGRAPWHALPAAVRARVVELARGKYAGFNHRHLAEKLAEVEQLPLGRTTVRRILLAAGEASPRPRRAPKHRRRRERMPREGMLLQADGSPHRWLGPDRPALTLVGAIDDATGTVPGAVFRQQEDAQGYLLLLRAIVLTRGIPLALYVDRHGIFKKSRREPLTLEEELAGGRLPTQVGRALEELGIRPIFALSPQAKGRIERLWGTLQGRLVAELRLAGADSLEAANRCLGPFLADFNARFAVPPAEPGSAYRPPPPAFDPDRVFCFKYERAVRADNTVHFAGRQLQLQPAAERASWARARVEVHERLDGSLAVLYRGTVIVTTPAPPDAPTLRARAEPRPGAGPPREPAPPPDPRPPAAPPRPRTPGPDHPWRRSQGVTKSRDTPG
jgi:transposase